MRSLILFLLIASFISFAQDEIKIGLTSSPSRSFIQEKSIDNFIFSIDTLNLPFIDDFSTNKIKNYSTDTSSIIHTIDSTFSRLINGEYVESLLALGIGDTSYSFIYNSVSEEYDTLPLTPYEIVNYSYLIYPSIPADTVYAWPPYHITIDDQGILDTNFLISSDTLWTTLINTFITLNDDASLWMNEQSNDVFINPYYPINPPTYGVATFDALNSLGQLHTGASDFSFWADELTSKPIDLSSYSASDSLILSFFYQPQGIGDYPSDGDSLTLEARSLNKDWSYLWSSNGTTHSAFYVDHQVDFLQVFINISDSSFFDSGFQFRFKNIASTAGSQEPSWASNADHWHIDYVILDANRSVLEKQIEDVAFVNVPNSILIDYTQVPWTHYQNRNFDILKDSTFNWAYNLDNNIIPKNITYDYEIFESSSLIHNSGNYTINLDPLTGYDFFGENDGLVLNSTDNDSANFLVQHIITTDANDLKINDTLKHQQLFHRAYAYDDGTAEAGYGVSANGGRVAYKFQSIQDGYDTLQAIQIYFNQVVNEANLRAFNLSVWEGGENGPTSLIYESIGSTPHYSDSLNKFIQFELDTTVLVGGYFYLGWSQNHEDLLNIGFDENANLSNKLYYSLPSNGGDWTVSSFNGALMMRPILGEKLPDPNYIEESNIEDLLFVYPNPTNGLLHINLGNLQTCPISIYNLNGQEVFRTRYLNNTVIDLSNVSAGIYIIQFNIEGNVKYKKLIINK